MAKSIGGVKRIEPPQSESSSAVTRMTDGTEMMIVVVWKKPATFAPMPVIYMWCAQTMKERKREHEDRADHRLVAVERLAGVVRDDFRDHADAGQDEHVHFRMREEPEQMLPEDRAAAAGPVCDELAVHDQARRHEEARAERAVHESA